MVSNVVIEGQSNAFRHIVFTDASTPHVRDMKITKCDIIDALNKASIVVSGASSYLTPSMSVLPPFVLDTMVISIWVITKLTVLIV